MAEDLDLDPELDKLTTIVRTPISEVVDESYETLKQRHEEFVKMSDKLQIDLTNMEYDELKKEKEQNNEPCMSREEYFIHRKNELEELSKKWQIPL